MHFARRYRLPAALCALAVFLCAIISKPFSDIGIADEGPYILTALKLAATGHVVYNGWVSAMLGWQLYLAVPFIKLFGPSFTSVRMAGLLVAMSLAFLLQRTFVRTGITERNATLATLAFVLSPLYLSLSVTFMTDIPGLLAIVLCLYGCLRALQSPTSRAAIAWLCFAVATNVLCGTSRQVAWLGVLTIVPGALWLLRSRRTVFIAGIAITLLGVLGILACSHWFSLQPNVVPPSDHLLAKSIQIKLTLKEFTHFFLNFPFLLLPLVAIFIPSLRTGRPLVRGILLALFLAYLLLALSPHPLAIQARLEPTFPQHFGLNPTGMFDFTQLPGDQPILFGRTILTFFTLASLGGLIGFIASFFPARPTALLPSATPSWRHLAILLTPFTLAYFLIILPRPSTFGLYERYALPLLVVALICLVRYYQQRFQPDLPLATLALIAVMAIFGIAITHNTFALYRARAALVAELRANGVPDTSVDNGWEYNFAVQIQRAGQIDIPSNLLPGAAKPAPAPAPQDPRACSTFFNEETPLIHALYGASFTPNACYGPAPFAPVQYSRWLATSPGTLYVVKYTPASKP